jgi:hypothetical protein
MTDLDWRKMNKRRQIVLELLVATALVAAILIVALGLFGRPAHGGEMVDCAEQPGSSATRWVYRLNVDGQAERKCWFPAKGINRGEEKPREELRWPSSKSIPMIYDPVKPQPVADPLKPLFDALPTPQSEFEKRWGGLEDKP